MRALVPLLLALTLAGCGGGDASTSGEEAWATDVCTSIASWRSEVEAIAQDAADAITQPGATRDTVENAVRAGLDATETLLQDLRASVPPDTEEGDEAQAAVDEFLDTVSAANDEVETAIAGLPEGAGLAQVITELSGLAASFQTTIESGQALVEELIEIGGGVRDAFADADACQELREPE